MAKLVDALVSGARAARHGGSSPFSGTYKSAKSIVITMLFVFKKLGKPQNFYWSYLNDRPGIHNFFNISFSKNSPVLGAFS